MNDSNLKRKQIKSGLSKLQPEHRLMFKRMYSHDNLTKPIKNVVDDMVDSTLDNALSQVTNTLKQYTTSQKIKHRLMGVFGK